MSKYNNWLTSRYIAHRGLHNEDLPENSTGAFLEAISHNYAIELDIQLLSDGTIAVFHDEQLSRMTKQDGYLSHLTKEDLTKFRLNNKDFCIPTFEQVLELVNGQVPLLIELKNTSKIGKLEQTTLEMLKSYNGDFAVQSFNPYSMEFFKDYAPDIMRGQLSCLFNNNNMNFMKKFVLKRLMLNHLSQPDFISYSCNALPNKYVNRYIKKHQGVAVLAWTVRSIAEQKRLSKFCDNIIFENFTPVPNNSNN